MHSCEKREKREKLTLSHLKMHSDAPGQDSVRGMEVKQDSNWVVPEIG